MPFGRFASWPKIVTHASIFQLTRWKTSALTGLEVATLKLRTKKRSQLRYMRDGGHSPLSSLVFWERSVSVVKIILAFCTALQVAEAFAAATVPSKAEAITFLSGLKAQNTVRLEDTDKAILKKLDETKDTRLLSALHTEIEKLRSDKRELLLRQDFLDRLILQFDTKYDGTHPRDFLEGALKKMAQVEISSPNVTTIWPFLDDLRRLISRVPDQQDRVLAIVEGYMKQTSIANPISPDEFLKNVAYSNGSQTEGAKPMDRAVVGEYAEKRLKQIQAQEKAPAPTPVVEAKPADTKAISTSQGQLPEVTPSPDQIPGPTLAPASTPAPAKTAN